MKAILDNRSVDVVAALDGRGNWRFEVARQADTYDFTVRPGAPTHYIVAAIERWVGVKAS